MASQQGKPNALPSPPQCSLSSEFLHRSLFCRVFFFLHNHLSSFSPRLLPPPASTFFPLPFLFRNLVLSPHLLISHPFVSHPFPVLCFSFSASIKPASFSPSPPPSALQSPAGLSAAVFCHHLSSSTASHIVISHFPKFSLSLAPVPLLSQPVCEKGSLCQC